MLNTIRTALGRTFGVFGKAFAATKQWFLGVPPNGRLIMVVSLVMALAFGGVLAVQNKPQQNPVQEQQTVNLQVDEQTPESEPEVAPAEPSQIVEVRRNPQNYIDQELQLSGLIENVHNNRIFTLRDEASNEFIYIITPRSLNDDEAEQTKDLFNGSNTANVTGTIRTFDTNDLKDQLNVALSDELAQTFSVKRLFLIVKTFEIKRN